MAPRGAVTSDGRRRHHLASTGVLPTRVETGLRWPSYYSSDGEATKSATASSSAATTPSMYPGLSLSETVITATIVDA